MVQYLVLRTKVRTKKKHNKKTMRSHPCWFSGWWSFQLLSVLLGIGKLQHEQGFLVPWQSAVSSELEECKEILQFLIAVKEASYS